MTILASDPSATWAGVLFDGLAGALIGAAATITVVVATIKHERSQRTHSDLDAAMASAAAAVSEHAFSVQLDGINSPRARATLRPMLQAMTPAITRAQATEPELLELLQAGLQDLTSTTAGLDGTEAALDAYKDACTRVSTALGYWFSNTELVRHGRLTYGHVRRAVEQADRAGLTPALNLKAPTRIDRWQRRVRRWRRR